MLHLNSHCAPSSGTRLLTAMLHATIDPRTTFQDRVRGLLSTGCRELQLSLGIVAEVNDDDYVVRHLWTDLNLPLETGARFDLGRTYCRETLDAGGPVGFHHAGESHWASHPAYADFGLEAYLGAPIYVDGRLWGTLNFSSPQPRARDFSAVEHEFVHLMALWLGQKIHRRAVEQALRHREAELAAMNAASPLGMFLTDADGFCSQVNERYQELSGLSLLQCLGTGWTAAIHPDDRQRVFREWHEVAALQEIYNSDIRYMRPDGTVIWANVKAAPMKDGDTVVGYVGTVDDVTARKLAEDELKRIASHDSLTGLPNRSLLEDRYEQAALRSARSGHPAHGILVLDFDGFKAVNDGLGHRYGDLLLIEIAKRLQNMLRETDTSCREVTDPFTCRTGGDEFVVLLNDLAHPTDATLVAERLLTRLAEPYELEGEVVHVTASIGIAVAGRQRESLEEMQHRADVAMYRAKAAGRNRAIMADDAGQPVAEGHRDQCSTELTVVGLR